MSSGSSDINTSPLIQRLTQLLQREEGQFLEFKSCIERPYGRDKRLRPSKDVAEDVAVVLSAMANADGGTLLVGIEDDKDISGVGYEKEDPINKIIRAPQNRVDPPLKTRLEKIFVDGKLVLLFEVDWSPDVHRLTDGRYLLRVGEHNQPYPVDLIHLMKEAKRKGLYERQFIPEATFDDLDLSLIEQFRQRAGNGESVKELLSRYRLIEEDNGRLRITRAALLLFARDPVKWHPRCGVDFVKYAGTDRQFGTRINVVKRERLDYPIVRLIVEAYRVIKEHIRERVLLHDLFFQEKFEYPTFAWQEAIINAIAHRDYSITGIQVEFWMFDDHLEVRSPGPPPEPVTIEQLAACRRVHFSRNPTIIRVLTDLGFTRELGEGIPRMFEEMHRQGLRPPEFKMEEFIFTVILRNQLVFEQETLSWLEHYKQFSLSPNQKRVLAYAKGKGMLFSSAEYQKVAEVDRDTAYKDIRNLLTSGVVQPVRKRGRTYRVIEPGEDAVSPADMIVKLLIPAIKEKGFIVNTDVRDALKVSRPEATRRLTNVVAEEYLKMIGKKYYPTEKLLKLIAD